MSENFKSDNLDVLVDEVSSFVENGFSNKDKFYKIKYYLAKFAEWFHEFNQRRPLVWYSVKRIFFAIITVYVSIFLIYCMLSFIITDVTLTADLTDKQLNQMGGYGSIAFEKLVNGRKAMLGLDKPLLLQILTYMRNITPFIPKTVLVDARIDSQGILTGTEVTKWFYLGITFSKNLTTPYTEVTSLFSNAVPLSLIVGGSGIIISYFIGIPLGIWSALKKEKIQDNVISFGALFIIAIPAVVIVTILYQAGILYFGAGTNWNSVNTITKIFPPIAIIAMVMPAITIETRRFVIDEMTSDYTKFAKSKGLGETYIFFVHVFRNAFIRMVRNIPTIIVFTIFGSSILTESMWSINGMSYYMVKAVKFKDLYTVLGYVSLSAAAGVITALVGDLLLAILDPRITLK